MPTPWRKKLYKELSSLNLSGKIIDLGGSRKSGYHEILKGDFLIEVANIDEGYGYDHKVDLEKSFLLSANSYDATLAINVMEHVYDYRNFLSESFRILRQGGSIVIAVPFMIQIHPCPHDYWRYSGDTLEKILSEAGFRDVNVVAVGAGPFTAAYQIIYNALYFDIIRFPFAFAAKGLDAIIKAKFSKKNYPLGYFATAKK
ncbi:MAG: methyltransferase domain-containing protein [Patescibacteria group bacterium]